MTSKALPWLVTLAVVGGFVAPWAWRRASKPATPSLVPPNAVAAVPSISAESKLAPAEPTPARSRAAEREVARQSTPRAFADETVWTLDVLVLDPDDQPLAGASVFLAPIELPLNTVGWTDARGRLQVELAAALDTQRVVVASEHERYGRSPLRVLEISPRPFHLAIELRPTPDAPRFAAEEAGSMFDARRDGGFGRERSSPSSESPHTPDRARLDEHGRLRFAQLLDDLPGAPLEAPRGWTVPEPPSPPTRELDPRDASILVKGIVRDARGTRVPDARVHVHDAERGLEFSMRSFQDGSFGLGPVPSRGMRLSIGGGDLGRYESDLGGGPERFQLVQAALQRGRELSGALTDDNALPLSGWRLEAHDPSGASAWADVTWSDAHGRFAVPNAPSTMLRVDVFAPDGGAFPVWSERGLWAQPECAIAVPSSVLERAALRVQVASAEGELLDDADVWLESEGADRTARATFDASSGAYAIERLPAGRYRMSVHHRGDRSIVWPTPIDVDGARTIDLGCVAFEKRGVLAVEADPVLGRVEYSLERRAGAWKLFLGAFEAHGRWIARLAPGGYVLRARVRGATSDLGAWELDVDARRARILRIDGSSAR